MNQDEILQKVEAALEILRPYLHADGGDLKAVEITPEMVLHLEAIGTCRDCKHIDQTIHNGISDAILKEVPSIKEIVVINLNK